MEITSSIVKQGIRDLGESQVAAPRRTISPRQRFWKLASRGLAAAVILGLAGSAFFSPSVRQYLQQLNAPPMLAATTQLPTPPRAPLAQAQALARVTATDQAPRGEIDTGLLQALWRVKIRTGSSVTSARKFRKAAQVAQAAQEMGLTSARFDTGMQQLQRLSRPCLIEVTPNPAAPQTTLWVLVQVQDDRILIYQEPQGITRIPRHLFEQQWYGTVYLTLEANQYRNTMLTKGMQGEPITKLQNVLKDLGYYRGSVSGYFEIPTLKAVKAFQRDHQLDVDGHVGPRTSMLLRHVGGSL